MTVERADSGNLDLLRSFAVVCVLVFHALLLFGRGQVPHGLVYLGHWGVLVFFVGGLNRRRFGSGRDDGR